MRHQTSCVTWSYPYSVVETARASSYLWLGPCQVSKTWNSQPGRSQFAQPSSKTKIQRATKTRENMPTRAAQSRVAKKVAPKRIEALPTNTAEPQLVNREDTKSTLANKTDSSPAPNPASGSEAGTTPEQVATAPPTEDLTTATAGPSQDKKPDDNTEPSSPSAAVFPAENRNDCAGETKQRRPACCHSSRSSRNQVGSRSGKQNYCDRCLAI